MRSGERETFCWVEPFRLDAVALLSTWTPGVSAIKEKEKKQMANRALNFGAGNGN